jgi:nucleoid-associated protein YgaU
VRRGDTLSSIAARHYNDPGLWRHIARANGISNPRVLTPGQVLRVPKLRR